MGMEERYYEGGYLIYPRDNHNISYMFNLFLGDDGVNVVSSTTKENRQELVTFGKYPSVYYTGNTSYKTFSLKHLFDSDVSEARTEPYHEVLITSPYQKFLKFESEVRRYKEWVVRGSMQGADHICNITIKNADFQQNAVAHGLDENWLDEGECGSLTYMDYLEVTIECVETDAMRTADMRRG